MTAAFAPLFLLLPGLIVWAAGHLPPLRVLGPVVACYAGGLMLGLSGWGAAAPGRVPVMEASLALALPLLLFGVDLRAWGRVAGRALAAMGLAIFAALVVALALFALFHGRLTEAEDLSAMAVAMYTGGLANLGAVKLALGVPEARYLTFALVDTGVGALYLLGVLTIGPALARRLLGEGTAGGAASPQPEGAEGWRWRALPVPLAASALCVGVAVILAPRLPLLPGEAWTIILITALGLLGSLVGPLRRNRAAPAAGVFLIYVFSFCVAAGFDLAALRGVEPLLLLFVLAATFGTLALHGLFCRLARIDGETFLVTSVAAILSPAFVPLIAPKLRDPALLVSGMTMGVLGFALGSYLGLATGLALEALTR